MIRSFRHKGLKRYWESNDTAKLPVQNVSRVRRILRTLHHADKPAAMNIPGWGFHGLKGERAGTYAVVVTGNWRITWRWDEGAIDVNIEDYH